MDITKFIDEYGDEIFALSLIVTKDFDSAKQVFVKTSFAHKDFTDDTVLFDIVNRVYSECAAADSNEGATTLTGVELDAKRQHILEMLLSLGEMTRIVVHMFYENDLSEKEIAKVTGQSEKHISALLSDISDELAEQLEKHYKYICTKIKAEDKLKAYTIRAISKGDKRLFEVKEEAVPTHKWKTSHKIIVLIAGILMASVISFVIPLIEEFQDRDLSSYESFSDQSFYYTAEAEDLQ